MPYDSSISQGRGGLSGFSQGPAPRDFAGDQAMGFDPTAMGSFIQWMARKRRGPGREYNPNPNMTKVGDPLARDKLLAAKAQLQAQYMAPPTRQVSGPGIITGLTPDTIRMSGAQREAFLPQNASFVGPMEQPNAFPRMDPLAAAQAEALRGAGQVTREEAQSMRGQRMYGGRGTMRRKEG